jgi:hypothetical protein
MRFKKLNDKKIELDWLSWRVKKDYQWIEEGDFSKAIRFGRRGWSRPNRNPVERIFLNGG